MIGCVLLGGVALAALLIASLLRAMFQLAPVAALLYGVVISVASTFGAWRIFSWWKAPLPLCGSKRCRRGDYSVLRASGLACCSCAGVEPCTGEPVTRTVICLTVRNASSKSSMVGNYEHSRGEPLGARGELITNCQTDWYRYHQAWFLMRTEWRVTPALRRKVLGNAEWNSATRPLQRPR